MKTLFDQTRIGTIQLRNRLVRPATWEAMAEKTGRRHSCNACRKQPDGNICPFRESPAGES